MVNSQSKILVMVIWAEYPFFDFKIGLQSVGIRLFDQLKAANEYSILILYEGLPQPRLLDLICKFPSIKILKRDEVYPDLGAFSGFLLLDLRTYLSQSAFNLISRSISETSFGFYLMDSSDKILGGFRNPSVLAVYLPFDRLCLLKSILDYFCKLRPDLFMSNDSFKDFVRLELNSSDKSLFGIQVESHFEASEAENYYSFEMAIKAMKNGVKIRSVNNVFIRGNLICGSDVYIDVNVIIEGEVCLENGARVEASSILRDCRVSENTIIKPFTLIEGASVGSDSMIGPYGRIRPGTTIGNNSQIGNYVEIKNSCIGDFVRINHHSFIGDADIQNNVTIGAGTITCNHNKNVISRTIIEEGAYIGSGCNLIAPLTIGKKATIGAGSTITEDVPAEKLTLARSRQQTIVSQGANEVRGRAK